MMTNAEVEKIVAHILQMRFQANGYSSSDVVFEEDFDGEEIIRVTVHVATRVENVDELFDSVGAIRDVLAKSGDDRFVFLDQSYPGDDDFEVEREDGRKGAH